jgi:hypothetical protein
MSSSQYTSSSGRTRLIAAATSAVLTSSIFVAVAVGMTSADVTGRWAAFVPATDAVSHLA